jgi:hypothetical protein
MPITSDGKEPNLAQFLTAIAAAVGKAVRKSYNPKEDKQRTQKDIVLANLDAAIASVSGDGEFEFGHRQLLYALRPIVMKEIGENLKTPNFNQIITDYENEHGDIPGAYHDPRGTIYHPHRKETLALTR